MPRKPHMKLRERRRARASTQTLTDLAVLFDQSAGGIQLSGDSGTGKSNAIKVIMQSLIRQGVGCALLDPHGDLANDMEAFCAGLPDRHRRRVVTFHPARTRQIAAINPLAVIADGSDSVTTNARRAAKVSHVSRILLHAWGERDFNGKPLLFKWTTRFLTTLAYAGLTIPDVRHFFDVRSPVYRALTRVAPDFIARLEFDELSEQRPRERE